MCSETLLYSHDLYIIMISLNIYYTNHVLSIIQKSVCPTYSSSSVLDKVSKLNFKWSQIYLVTIKSVLLLYVKYKIFTK